MAISKLVDYEVTSTNELLSPDGSGLGIMVTVKSEMSTDVKAISKRITAGLMSLQMAKEKGITDDVIYDRLVSQEDLTIAKAAASIVSIDWGDEEWHEGKGPLPDTVDGNIEFASEDWIYSQLIKWVASISDFTKA